MLVLAGLVWLLFAGSVATLTVLVVADGSGLGLLLVVVALAFALTGPLVFWLVARRTWRAAHPRRLKGVEVAVDRDRLARGETVSASVSATGEHPDLEVGLVCRAHADRLSRSGADSSPARVTDVVVLWEQWSPASGAAGLGARARLTIPPEQPYSWEGDCLSFAWSVAARRPGEARTSPPVPLWVEP